MQRKLENGNKIAEYPYARNNDSFFLKNELMNRINIIKQILYLSISEKIFLIKC